MAMRLAASTGTDNTTARGASTVDWGTGAPAGPYRVWNPVVGPGAYCLATQTQKLWFLRCSRVRHIQRGPLHCSSVAKGIDIVQATTPPQISGRYALNKY